MRFESAFENVRVVKGKVRQPSFNGKVERLLRPLRIWLRRTVLPISIRPLQRRLDLFQAWYNEHGPHAALDGRTPNEACDGVELSVGNQLLTPLPLVSTTQTIECDERLGGILKFYRRGQKSA